MVGDDESSDPEREAALHQLARDHADGKLTTFEYNARKRALLAGTKDAPPPAAAEPAIPKGWGEAKRGAGMKTWSEGARTDDPSLRQVHAPLAPGIGDGKAVHFLFGFRKSAKNDQIMLERELAAIQDDIETLRNAGYTVVVDPQATKEEFVQCVTGKDESTAGLAPVALYWSAHGHEDGSLDCCDGRKIAPSEIDASSVAPSLKLAILAACYVGAHSRTWRRALGGHPLVVGWGRPVTIDRAVEFLDSNPETETDLDDLIRRYLLADTPLPGEPGNAYSPLEAKLGQLADLPERIKAVAAMLGARYREHERTVEVDVPLPEGRSHYVHVSVIDCSEPYAEGEPLLSVEADIGELTSLVDPPMLLSGFSNPGFARVSLVKGAAEMPRIVAQGHLPIARSRDTDLAALVYQVAAVGDELERRIFGGDMR